MVCAFILQLIGRTQQALNLDHEMAMQPKYVEWTDAELLAVGLGLDTSIGRRESRESSLIKDPRDPRGRASYEDEAMDERAMQIQDIIANNYADEEENRDGTDLRRPMLRRSATRQRHGSLGAALGTFEGPSALAARSSKDVMSYHQDDDAALAVQMKPSSLPSLLTHGKPPQPHSKASLSVTWDLKEEQKHVNKDEKKIEEAYTSSDKPSRCKQSPSEILYHSLCSPEDVEEPLDVLSGMLQQRAKGGDVDHVATRRKMASSVSSRVPAGFPLLGLPPEEAMGQHAVNAMPGRGPASSYALARGQQSRARRHGGSKAGLGSQGGRGPAWSASVVDVSLGEEEEEHPKGRPTGEGAPASSRRPSRFLSIRTRVSTTPKRGRKSSSDPSSSVLPVSFLNQAFLDSDKSHRFFKKSPSAAAPESHCSLGRDRSCPSSSPSPSPPPSSSSSTSTSHSSSNSRSSSASPPKSILRKNPNSPRRTAHIRFQDDLPVFSRSTSLTREATRRGNPHASQHMQLSRQGEHVTRRHGSSGDAKEGEPVEVVSPGREMGRRSGRASGRPGARPASLSFVLPKPVDEEDEDENNEKENENENENEDEEGPYGDLFMAPERRGLDASLMASRRQGMDEDQFLPPSRATRNRNGGGVRAIMGDPLQRSPVMTRRRQYYQISRAQARGEGAILREPQQDLSLKDIQSMDMEDTPTPLTLANVAINAVYEDFDVLSQPQAILPHHHHHVPPQVGPLDCLPVQAT